MRLDCKSNFSEGYQGTTQISPSFESHSISMQNNQRYASSDSWSPLIQQQLHYKTILCQTFVMGGICRFDKSCTFAHGSVELCTIPRHP